MNTFGGVLGWDSEHCRRVQWEESLTSMICRIHLLHNIQFPVKGTKSYAILNANTLSARELGEELFAAGLAIDSVERAMQAIDV